MNPLVSVITCAFNVEKTIEETLRSALAQTWDNKEIIVIDDGSTDMTPDIVRRFPSVTLISTENRGFSKAQNLAIESSRGDYVQFLDADDLLAPDKVERQVLAAKEIGNDRILPISPWAPFYYRVRNARFVENSLCASLSPVDWLSRKMRTGDHMQNATWLVSRELIDEAGPWDTELVYDQDGEYFARVLLASEGTHFIPDTGIYYRQGPNRMSYIGNSDAKKESLLRSMKLHIEYLLSLEDSERTRSACFAYIKIWSGNFYPERPDLFAELSEMASQLQYELEPPELRPKYRWIQGLFGYEKAKHAQAIFPNLRVHLEQSVDKAFWAIGK